MASLLAARRGTGRRGPSAQLGACFHRRTETRATSLRYTPHSGCGCKVSCHHKPWVSPGPARASRTFRQHRRTPNTKGRKPDEDYPFRSGRSRIARGRHGLGTDIDHLTQCWHNLKPDLAADPAGRQQRHHDAAGQHWPTGAGQSRDGRDCGAGRRRRGHGCGRRRCGWRWWRRGRRCWWGWRCGSRRAIESGSVRVALTTRATLPPQNRSSGQLVSVQAARSRCELAHL